MIAQVAMKEFLAGFAIQPAASGVAAPFSEGGMKTSAEEIAAAATTANPFENTQVHESRKP